jgi:regulation of enolase protein 1 (concanavalin A-like superfamily)
MRWYNEPLTWHEQDGTLTVTTDAKTDFWRKTHYDFIRDNGNFYYQEIAGDFMAAVKVSGQYQALYDQAGLMIRADRKIWLKCGIEFVNEQQHVSAVVTRDYSDWSMIPLPQHPTSLWLRVKRKNGSIEAWYSLEGEDYILFRMAYLSEATVQVGPMSASPQGAGFPVVFEAFHCKAN